MGEKDIKPWWEDYDGDIEEERREINKRLDKVVNSRERAE